MVITKTNFVVNAVRHDTNVISENNIYIGGNMLKTIRDKISIICLLGDKNETHVTREFGELSNALGISVVILVDLVYDYVIELEARTRTTNGIKF